MSKGQTRVVETDAILFTLGNDDELLTQESVSNNAEGKLEQSKPAIIEKKAKENISEKDGIY